ncbi:hypothetical protein [Aquabacterium sp. OR-4]|uniref:hypothetical protein n=1 Tax=Aquabacterium sp. OR-4 TaxID=2978127 RepID=UPI0021B31C74|nr:hypothetical protein [Aquabacterium sp. OR-4]MDT7835205.1 hypothetical protein [Aquabacterium sp. OR-4]
MSRRSPCLLGLALCAGTLPALASEAPVAHHPDSAAEITLRADGRTPGGHGPLATAQALAPGTAAPVTDGLALQAELRHALRGRLGGHGLALQANALLAHEWRRQRSARGHSRVNELQASLDLGAWQLAAGKKVLGWDVGYGFRPNDVVQQEERRTQFGQTPEGRPLLMAEHFGADTAWSFVWANPQRWNVAPEQQRGGRESALAARWYGRQGSWDLHALARQGRHTGSSLGAAAAWVATDALELHASARLLQRHDGWRQAAAAPDALLRHNPWQRATLGRARQWLIGGQWTGELQQSLMVEAWHDGSALPDAAWDAWANRNQALAAWATRPGLPAEALAGAAGNLAWQASPFDAASLRRDNLFVRLAWQPGPWQLTLDTLWQPADRGRIVTAGLQWQGDRLRLNASWRQYGGPGSALLAQLPTRRNALLAASMAF